MVLTLRDRYSNDLSSKNIYVPKLKLLLKVAAPPPASAGRPLSASPSRRRLSEAVAAAAGRPAAEAEAEAVKAEAAEAAEAVAASWHVAEDGRVAVTFTPTSVGTHLLHATLGGAEVCSLVITPLLRSPAARDAGRRGGTGQPCHRDRRA